MYSHAPPAYRCPFCAVASGLEVDYCYTVADDIVLRNDQFCGFISSHWWPGNRGHVLLIPNEHFENMYALPDEYGPGLLRASRRIALALKAVYGCEGVSTRQHNEPAGMQEVWHFHLHIFPRYAGDGLYARTAEQFLATPSQRRPYAEKLRRALNNI